MWRVEIAEGLSFKIEHRAEAIRFVGALMDLMAYCDAAAVITIEKAPVDGQEQVGTCEDSSPYPV